MKKGLLIIQFCVLVTYLEAANILILLPLPLYSHVNPFFPVFEDLATRGHNITMVSPFPQKKPIANWTDVVVKPTVFNNNRVLSVIDRSGHWFYLEFWDFCVEVVEDVLQEETLKVFLNGDNSSYDLIIMEPYFCAEPLIAAGHKLNAPVVAIQAMSLTPWYAYLTGNEISFPLMPNIRSGYTSQMSFFQRLDNALINLIEFGLGYFKYLPEMQAMMDKYVRYPGFETRPPMLNMLRNVSLILCEYHFSVGYVEPLQPNTIPVGGIGLKNSVELPKDLEDIMNKAQNGVIYLSFGSLVKSDQMPKGVLETLVSALAELNQTVLFKSDLENLPNKPKNVEVRKWFPQQSILAHPNVRLFITHAGLHSITEASYYGVPVLCIPFFADQLYDSRFTEVAGFGLLIRLYELTKEKIINSVHKLLNDSRFKENAMLRSKIVRDRPQSSFDSAVYWIEYVLRHKGAKHLKPPRADLALYEVLYLDVILFIACAFAMPVILILCLRRRKVNKTKKD